MSRSAVVRELAPVSGSAARNTGRAVPVVKIGKCANGWNRRNPVAPTRLGEGPVSTLLSPSASPRATAGLRHSPVIACDRTREPAMGRNSGALLARAVSVASLANIPKNRAQFPKRSRNFRTPRAWGPIFPERGYASRAACSANPRESSSRMRSRSRSRAASRASVPSSIALRPINKNTRNTCI